MQAQLTETTAETFKAKQQMTIQEQSSAAKIKEVETKLSIQKRDFDQEKALLEQKIEFLERENQSLKDQLSSTEIHASQLKSGIDRINTQK